MNNRLSPGALIIRNVIWNEIKRAAPKPPKPPLGTNSRCSFACYFNDGRGDLKSCGTVLRMVRVPETNRSLG